MKLSASLVARSVKQAYGPTYASKLASHIQPGNTIELVDGSRFRVLQRTATQAGARIRLSGRSGQRVLSAEQFSQLAIVSPAMKRLASFVHRITASDAPIDLYVKEAIRKAGLPVDETVDWSKYLKKMYGAMLRTITQDPDLMDDAIISVIVDELYTKNLLSPDSPYAHFNPDHEKLEGKDLAQKVTAYLINVFKGRKGLVKEYAQRELGVGAQGTLGLAPSQSLSQPNKDEDGTPIDFDQRLTDPNAKHQYDELEGDMDVKAFLQAFDDEILVHQRKNSAPILKLITKAFADGYDRKEIKDRVMNDPGLEEQIGKKLNRDAYNWALAQWNKLLRAFAADPANPWSKTPIARMIVDAAKGLDKPEGVKEQVHASSLHLADYEQNGEPVAPQQPVHQAPPQNPNVLQQKALGQRNGLNIAPTGDQDPTDVPQTGQDDPQQPKKTIQPEIPGVNHTASEDVMEKTAKPTEQAKTASKETAASPSAKVATQVQQKKSTKFASLKRYASEEPQELQAALEQLGDTFQGLSDKLRKLREDLDLVSAPKEASVREKVASRNRYARKLKQLASETPDAIAEDINALYSELDNVVAEVENLADNLDIDLNVPETTDEFADDSFESGDEDAPLFEGPAEDEAEAA